MEIDIKILLVGELYQVLGGGVDVVGILNVVNEKLQVAVRRTKAIVISRNRNNAAMFS
jgi:hypothetical protein